MCRIKVLGHFLCVSHLSRGGQDVVDDKTIPCCTHKVEVVGAGEELGLEVNSEILLKKRRTTPAEVMGMFFKLT